MTIKANGKTFELHAWTGGDVPSDNVDATSHPDFFALWEILLEDQIKAWKEYWGDEPDADTWAIFNNRAKLDAWRTATWAAEKEERFVEYMSSSEFAAWVATNNP